MSEDDPITATNRFTADAVPTTKVTAGGIAGAVTVVLVYLLDLAHVTVPATVGSALTVIFGVVAGYLVKEHTVAGHRSGTASEG